MSLSFCHPQPFSVLCIFFFFEVSCPSSPHHIPPMAQHTTPVLPPVTHFAPTTPHNKTMPVVHSLRGPAFISLQFGVVLSTIGCLVIIGTYASSKTLQSKLVLRQVFFQSIATLLHSLSFLLSFGQIELLPNTTQPVEAKLPNAEFYCQLQGVLIESTGMAGFIFNFYIAWDLLSYFGYTPRVQTHRLL